MMSTQAMVQTQAMVKPTYTPMVHGSLQRCTATTECAECRKKREGMLQRAAVTSSFVNNVPSLVHEVLRSPGQPLDDATRAFMEPRFGHDFSNVRIHTDRQAADSARSVNALAYTIGQNVVFGHGQYSPVTDPGRRLIAHELTHVVQQSGSTAIQSAAAIGQPGDSAEHEAEKVSRVVISGAQTTASALQRRSGLQRQSGTGTAGARPPRRTIWVNIGFDSSARANEETMRKLRASIAMEKFAIFSCCLLRGSACDVDVKTHYDWNRVNKPAPRDGDYDDDNVADSTLRDRNLANITGPANGRKVLVTESTLSQTWQGTRIFPRANTGTSGILWNRALAAVDTIAHESGHAAGYTGDSEGGAHSSDPGNLMSPGSQRSIFALPDANWCTQMAATAH